MFTRGERKTFRIMVALVGDTVFFIRREGSPRECIQGVRGYGHTMPEAYTTWHADVKRSVSNQRVLRYRFAGLQCLVRYESDGYLSEKADGNRGGAKASTWPGGSRKVGGGVDELDAAMQGAYVSGSALPPEEAEEKLKVQQAGAHVAQSATFELKTRTITRKDEDFFDEFGPRLWLTQTPYFILAFHYHGRFDEIRVQDVRGKVEAWEARHQADLGRLAGLLQWIVNRMKTEPDGMLELWRHEEGNLELRSPGPKFYGALPGDVKDRWVDGGDAGGIHVSTLQGGDDTLESSVGQ